MLRESLEGSTLTKRFHDQAALLSTERERRELIKAVLPSDHRPYTDKYFLRSNTILEKEGLNPFVRAQVFLRGSGKIFGIDEAVAIIDKFSPLLRNGGRVFAKQDGDNYSPLESVMIIEARIQDIVELETMYLGVIAAETTKYNHNIDHVDLDLVKERTSKICALIGDRPLTYFGARHWRYDEDFAIARAAIEGGALGASTDVGANAIGKKGLGTIPHALENIYAYKYGRDSAVVEATRAFNRVIERSIPRIALIDYNNREIDDSIATAYALGSNLSAVRVDTCGENIAQGAFKSLEDVPFADPIREAAQKVPNHDLKYWFGNGVTVSGVVALRNALDAHGFEEVEIILTSGFGSIKKVEAFVRAEKVLCIKLFDALGVGGLYSPINTTTMDIVAVADTRQELDSSPLSKVGRDYHPNPNLKLKLGL